jgi:NAD(P)-dependent dehydrogenase (short-subunit alcohol dehydrogenase family)
MTRRMSEPMLGRVVVITGASSGVGRAAAAAFAKAGARVALLARRRAALEDAARACDGTTRVWSMDVTRDEDVTRVVSEIQSAWGRIDVWINNAGVTLFAPLDAGAFADHERVLQTNLLGAMRCARAVLPVFKAQRHGVLINVCSVLAEVGQPFVPSYAISKFALRGLSECLRPQFAEYPDIHVCSIFPYTIDTPHFQSGANMIGRRARALPPIQSPERVARALVDLARRPRRELHVPRIAVLGLVARALFPVTTERLLLRVLTRWHFDDTPQPPTSGNLYAPVEEHEARIHGERRPQLSTARFVGWTARELVRMELSSLTRHRSRRAESPRAKQEGRAT